MGFQFIQGNKLALILLFQRIPKVHFQSATGADQQQECCGLIFPFTFTRIPFFPDFPADNAQDTRYFRNVSHPRFLLVHSLLAQQPIFVKEHVFNVFFDDFQDGKFKFPCRL